MLGPSLWKMGCEKQAYPIAVSFSFLNVSFVKKKNLKKCYACT